MRAVVRGGYTDAMYLEDRVMNTSAALERFDKVRGPDPPKVFRDGKWHDPSFVDRIVACSAYAGPTDADLIVEEASVWVKRVKVVGNELAHHDDLFRITGEVGEHVLAEQV